MSQQHQHIEFALAEFVNPAALLHAAGKLREAGYKKFDCHSPFPIHGMDQAMGLRRSPLGWIAGLVALVGCGAALGLQWWTMAVDYPLVISGKPYFAFQAYVPVTFALGVLMAGFAALFGMLIINRLPQLNHPLFNSANFERFSDDGFFISIESSDPIYERTKVQKFLEELGGKNFEVLRDE
jgi:hypothetical protein